jgi:hypothetical protein
MINWLRRVTPDLFLAAVVALLLTLALNQLDKIEGERIVGNVRWAARDGLTIDERMGAFDDSIRRSIFIHQPLLVATAAICVGGICRNRRWAWLTAVLAVVPALLMGAGFLIDDPLMGSAVTAYYIVISTVIASLSVTVRNRIARAAAPGSE